MKLSRIKLLVKSCQHYRELPATYTVLLPNMLIMLSCLHFKHTYIVSLILPPLTITTATYYHYCYYPHSYYHYQIHSSQHSTIHLFPHYALQPLIPTYVSMLPFQPLSTIKLQLLNLTLVYSLSHPVLTTTRSKTITHTQKWRTN